MITQKIKKLKKYLLLISCWLFTVTTLHLTLSYLYSNSKTEPEKGGIISEWIIWKFPSLNPIVPLYSDWNEKYIIDLLYRSLLKYDIDKQKIVWDIANCDITSLVNISCIINQDNAKWSNGNPITADDIRSTYQLIRESKSNPILVSLLEETDIEAKENVIVFKNKKKDLNFLNVFFQPILNKDFIDTLSTKNLTWNFPISGWIYSWKYIIDKPSEDENLWITKLTLLKNPYYDKANASKIILNIFPDINSFKKNYQAVNIFNDSENSIWNSLYKFQPYSYKVNSFVWLFLNQNKIENNDLRTYILNKVDNSKLVKVLWEQNFWTINNPFLWEETISRDAVNKNFDSVMASIWYKKKSVFMQNPNLQKNVETPKVEEKKSEEISIPEDLSIETYQQDSKYITSPAYVDLYNFITKDDVLISWPVSGNVEAVFVNDYKLASFSQGNSNFYYRLKESIWTLKAWVNTYKIYFQVAGKKEFKEEITFVYYNDKEVLKKAEKDLAISIFKKNWEAENKKVEAQKVETPKVEEPKESFSERLAKLDENFYYDNNLKEFTLNLYYLNDGKKETTDTVNFITNSLKELWIKVEGHSFDFKELANILSSKEYDMILTWIHLWYINYNLFPYLHSSQAKSGYNFSNIRKPALDLLLEEQKESILSEDRRKQIRQKVITILKDEQVMKTLYTPKINLLIDKNNIKLDKKYEFIPYKSERHNILENSYTKESKKINFEWKSFTGFFKYLAQKMYE